MLLFSFTFPENFTEIQLSSKRESVDDVLKKATITSIIRHHSSNTSFPQFLIVDSAHMIKRTSHGL